MEYLCDFPKHLKPLVPADNGDRQRLDLAFSKSQAEDRKDWLRKYDRESVIDHSQRRVRIEHFADKDPIHFSTLSNTRSIPNVVDGRKPSERNILFAAILKKLHPNTEVKVPDFAGYVGEKTAYNHGEAPLAQTIVNMASDYLGSNNLNLLEPRVQLGTRLQEGKDHASPRYIFTAIEAMSRKRFRPRDDELLKYEEEFGKEVEPRYYVQVIPMILMNGAEGKWIGWSTKIPPHIPQDVIDNLRLPIQDPEVELRTPPALLDSPTSPVCVGDKLLSRLARAHSSFQRYPCLAAYGLCHPPQDHGFSSNIPTLAQKTLGNRQPRSVIPPQPCSS